MLKKIWAITWKELYLGYTDRNAVLIRLVTPLALALLTGLALGNTLGGSSNDLTIQDISVAVVNLDEGGETGVVYGDIYACLTVRDKTEGCEDTDPETVEVLHTLLEGVAVADPDVARADVDSGEYSAAVIIPADFSQKMSYEQGQPFEAVSVEVYGNESRPISVSIVYSITESIINQFATGSITVAASIEALIAEAETNPEFGAEFGQLAINGGFNPDFAAAFDPASNPLHIDQQSISGVEVEDFNPLVYFGSANAIFFMMFTAQAGANGLMRERREWTLQRLIISPTPRIAILLGKLGGTLANCIVQLLVLFAALTLVASFLEGSLQFIWGTNLVLIFAVIVAASLAASGFGALINAIVRTPEEGSLIATSLIILMGLLSGTFFPGVALESIDWLSKLTINYWGIDAFRRLASGDTQIGLNMAILTIQGGVMFLAGLFIFNRRLSI